MTVKELQEDFEKQFSTQIKKGLEFAFAAPLRAMINDKGLFPGEEEDTAIHPSTHRLYAFRPFVFDIRQLPETFLGFHLVVFVSADTIPDEFRLDEENILPVDICWSPERVIVYAEEHALDICKQLNDYTFTLKDICDMIADGDFERHKKMCELARSKRLSAETDEEENLD